MLDEHLGYVADRFRVERFREAVARAIRPGDVVADLGCGSGVLGLLCLQAGAKRLYAIDSTAMIDVAQESLNRAGFADRAVFLRSHSHRVELPERVDVAICDHVGYFGFDYGIVHTLQDARRRFLKPGGVVIPARIRLHTAAVASEKCRDKAEGWLADSVPPEFHWLREHGVNSKHRVRLTPENLLGPAVELGDVDLASDNPEYFSWSAGLHIVRDGVLHGIAGWFDCELIDGIWMTNSPLSESAIDRPQVFLPIDQAVPVKAGDPVRVTVMVRPTDNLIAWVVDFPTTGQRFAHSTWQGMLGLPEELRRSNPDRVPRFSHDGSARMTVLGYCDGTRTAREIEKAVLREHPTLFPSAGEISRFVAQVLARDTE